jgi:hypothetical protein
LAELITLRMTARLVRWLPWPRRTSYWTKETTKAEAERFADYMRERGVEVEILEAAEE